eukprot:g29504.t1
MKKVHNLRKSHRGLFQGLASYHDSGLSGEGCLGICLRDLHGGCSGLCVALLIRLLVVLWRILIQAFFSFVFIIIFGSVMSILGVFLLSLLLGSFVLWCIPVDCCMRSEADCCLQAFKDSYVILCKAVFPMVAIFFLTWCWIRDYYQTIIFEYKQPFSGLSHIVYHLVCGGCVWPCSGRGLRQYPRQQPAALDSVVASWSQRQPQQQIEPQPPLPRSSSSSSSPPLAADLLGSNFVNLRHVHRRAGTTSAGRTKSWEILLPRVAPERSSITADCVLCTEEQQELFRISQDPACEHRFCKSCIENTMNLIMKQRKWPGQCPCEHKAEKIRFITAEILAAVSAGEVSAPDLAGRFLFQQISAAEPGFSGVTCPVASCGSMSLVHESQGACLLCRDSSQMMCWKCSIPWHTGLTCAEYQARFRDQDDKTQALIRSTSKPCPNCSAPTSHYREHECHHIRPGTGCPSCHHHFCYVCLQSSGLSWVKRCTCPVFCDQTCGCPICPDCKPGRPCSLCPNDDGRCAAYDVCQFRSHGSVLSLRRHRNSRTTGRDIQTATFIIMLCT